MLGESGVEVSREMSSATSCNLKFAALSTLPLSVRIPTHPRPLDDAAPPLAIVNMIRYPGS